ncbi:MAG: hypothetical protein U0T69_05565 [Chitinophagales bacterium]
MQPIISDALVLSAINSKQGICLKNGLTIVEVINYIDYFDRTILTYNEFSDAINRLMTIGFIKIVNDKIYTTKYFRQQIKMHCKKVSGYMNQLEELKKVLDINKNNFIELENTFDTFLSLDSYETAMAAYRSRRF